MSRVTAVILIGGESTTTSFRPLSLSTPAPLLHVGPQSLLDHVAGALATVQGLTSVFVLGFFERSKIQGWLDEAANKWKDIKWEYLAETEPMGTAGGLLAFEQDIIATKPDAVIVAAGDIFCSFPFQQLLSFHRAHGKTATVMGVRVAKERATRHGCLVTRDSDSHQVIHYVEKPHTYISNLVNCGLYVFSPGIFAVIRDHFSGPKTPARAPHILLDKEHSSGYVSMEIDILPKLCTMQGLFVHESPDKWQQIKSASMLLHGIKVFLSSPKSASLLAAPGPNIVAPVYIHPSAKIDPTAKIGPNVTISADVVIGPGVRVVNSFIMQGCNLKPNSCIMNSILAEQCQVGVWARVEGLPDDHDYKLENMKPGNICVFGTGVKVHSEVIIRGCIVLPNKELTHNYFSEILL